MKYLANIRTFAIAALVAVIALGATACGSGSSGSSSNPAAAGGSTSTGSTQGTLVNVSLKEYSVTVSGGTNLAPGTYTFHVTNNGTLGHNLTVNGPGVSTQTTGTFAPGGTSDLTVTLQNGMYDLYCSVPGHKQLGMNASVTVGTGGAGGGSSGGGTSGGGSSQSGGGWS
jgi:plastocyanin